MVNGPEDFWHASNGAMCKPFSQLKLELAGKSTNWNLLWIRNSMVNLANMMRVNSCEWTCQYLQKMEYYNLVLEKEKNRKNKRKRAEIAIEKDLSVEEKERTGYLMLIWTLERTGIGRKEEEFTLGGFDIENTCTYWIFFFFFLYILN